MEDENRNPFVLNTSIIVPIAIAAGVAFIIIIFLYCCRHFVYNKRILGGSHVRSTAAVPAEPGGRRVVIQPRGRGGVTEAFRHQFIPWSTGAGHYQRHTREQQVYPTPTHNRANYNSTQVISLANILYLARANVGGVGIC